MAERTVTIRHRQNQETMQVVVRTSERAGRWVARVIPGSAPGTPSDWPGIASPDKTQRVWVGETEAEAVQVAMDWLRAQYRLEEP